MDDSAILRRNQALDDVATERVRQERLKRAGKFSFTCADEDMDLPPGLKLAILTEEVGEVARCINERDQRTKLREELCQVAAVCVAWMESIDEYYGESGF